LYCKEDILLNLDLAKKCASKNADGMGESKDTDREKTVVMQTQ